MSEHHKSLRLRQFAGEINRADAVYIPVFFHSSQESFWMEVPKTNAKELIAHATEHGIEEVEGITIEDGCLYIDGPGEEGETPGEKEEEEEEETEEEEEEINS